MQIDKILKGLSGRYIFLIILSFTVVSILIIWLAQLQLSYDSKYTERIRKQSLRPIRVPPVRGRIESSDGVILVDNKVSYDLMFYLKEFRLRGAGEKTRTAEYMEISLKRLADLLNLESGINRKEILDNLNSESSAKEVLVSELSSEQKKSLKNFNLPKFIVNDDNGIYLDYSKVELLGKMGARDRTAEKICREIDRVNTLIGRPLVDHREKVLKHLLQMPALPYKALENLNQEELAIISEMIPRLSGTSIESNTNRTYPFPYEYSHLLGMTRLPDFGDIDSSDKESFFYYIRSLYGVNGLESKMNKELTGEAGKKLVQVNISGFVQGGEEGKHSLINDDEIEKFNYLPINGNNIRLTLNHEAQLLAYNLLKNIPRQNLGTPLDEGQSVRGSFVLMDCQTGEIKAMVSTPSYDLSRFREREYYKSIVHPDNEKSIPYPLRQEPMTNRSLANYEPGSTIKPLIALAGLELAGLDPAHELECEGFYEFSNGKKIHCATRWGHGGIDLGGAIEQSCNKYFITLGMEMGINKVQPFLKATGIGRYPMALNDSSKRFSRESRGLLPGTHKNWIYSDLAYSSIGQGKILASPLQVAVFVSAIANGGKVLQPQLIKEIRGSKNEQLERKINFPVVVNNLPAKAENIEIIQQSMRRVVSGENASATTARAIYEGSMQLAGKTGTAEVKYRDLDEDGKALRDVNGKLMPLKKIKNTWFTAYGPYDNPKYVAICFVQGGIFGGTTCAPIVRKFFDTWSVTRPETKKEE